MVSNGSPLFTGDAGSGESNIRRWIIENDWLEAIVALPDQLFYNTGISTYFWIVTNRKRPERQGKVQLIDATGFSQKMRKSLGNKRNEISEEQVEEITRIYGEFAEGAHCKIFANEDFGYRKITVERPLRLNFQISAERLERLQAEKVWQKVNDSEAVLAMLRGMPEQTWTERPAFETVLRSAARATGPKLDAPLKKSIFAALSERDETASVCLDAKGNAEPDPELRDTENVPLGEDVGEYMAREVLPYVPDAWVDGARTKVGYELNFNRYFYTYVPPRPLAEIEADIRTLETEIVQMLGEITGGVNGPHAG
jgi:type I restriction enzyme M protein